MKQKVYPFVSKELVDKILKDPSVCKKILAQERAMAIKLQGIVMKHLCSKEFLEGMIKKKEG